MPAIRSTPIAAAASATVSEVASARSKYFGTQPTAACKESRGQISDAEAQCEVQAKPIPGFPASVRERELYRAPSGKKITSHQWNVYDYTLKIPRGKVATYKDVAEAVGGSPRSVGNALRNNPFAPYVPCHRVIASNLFVGGFMGEWGKDHKSGTRCNQKLDLLSTEGVTFDGKGYLLTKDQLVR